MKGIKMSGIVNRS